MTMSEWRKENQRLADWCAFWCVAAMVFAGALYVLGRWDIHNRHLLDPHVCYGFALAFVAGGIVALIFAVIFKLRTYDLGPERRR